MPASFVGFFYFLFFFRSLVPFLTAVIVKLSIYRYIFFFFKACMNEFPTASTSDYYNSSSST